MVNTENKRRIISSNIPVLYGTVPVVSILNSNNHKTDQISSIKVK